MESLKNVYNKLVGNTNNEPKRPTRPKINKPQGTLDKMTMRESSGKMPKIGMWVKPQKTGEESKEGDEMDMDEMEMMGMDPHHMMMMMERGPFGMGRHFRMPQQEFFLPMQGVLIKG